jgi:predicted glycoside hydrolase/deacetylase ChbG (UPF0249 family)
MGALIIVADDYGYSPRYDQGILEAVRAGAVDAVSAMVTREGHDPTPLVESGVEVGLHLELGAEGEAVQASLEAQLQAFEEMYGAGPGYLDGHRHCHASPEAAALVGKAAAARGLAVRSVSGRHRALLRRLGVPTPGRLVGRIVEEQPFLPREIDALMEGGGVPEGVTEWMVHPGYRDPYLGSSYDAGREEDLRCLLALGDREKWRRRGVARTTHEALRE